eukprot:gene10293-13837_t
MSTRSALSIPRSLSPSTNHNSLSSPSSVIAKKKIDEIAEQLLEVRRKRLEFNGADKSNSGRVHSARRDYAKKVAKSFHHPNFEYVLGEIVYSPYLTRPSAAYSDETFQMASRLRELRKTGCRFKDLPKEKAPYNLIEAKNKFINDVVNYNPSFTKPKKHKNNRDASMSHESFFEGEDESFSMLTSTDADMEPNHLRDRGLMSNTTDAVSIGSTYKSKQLLMAEARGGPEKFRQKLRALKPRRNPSSRSMNPSSLVLQPVESSSRPLASHSGRPMSRNRNENQPLARSGNLDINDNYNDNNGYENDFAQEENINIASRPSSPGNDYDDDFQPDFIKADDNDAGLVDSPRNQAKLEIIDIRDDIIINDNNNNNNNNNVSSKNVEYATILSIEKTVNDDKDDDYPSEFNEEENVTNADSSSLINQFNNVENNADNIIICDDSRQEENAALDSPNKYDNEEFFSNEEENNNDHNYNNNNIEKISSNINVVSDNDYDDYQSDFNEDENNKIQTKENNNDNDNNNINYNNNNDYIIENVLSNIITIAPDNNKPDNDYDDYESEFNEDDSNTIQTKDKENNNVELISSINQLHDVEENGIIIIKNDDNVELA